MYNITLTEIYKTLQPYVMKSYYRALFICRSLLWSVLLYATAVLILDWEEVMITIKKKDNIQLVKITQHQPDIVPHAGEAKPAYVVKKLLSCMAKALQQLK